MGPKGRKAAWQTCGVCESSVSCRDLEVHAEQCHLPPAARSHCFISARVFYSKFQEIKSTEIEENVRDFKNDLIFMSQSAMQLCGFLVGDPVLVAAESQVLVRKAWPRAEGALTAAKIYNSGSPEINQNVFKEIIKISNFPSPPVPLKEIRFIVKNKVSNLESFLQILRFKYKHKIFSKNASIYVPFYGQWIRTEMVEMVPEADEGLDLSRLSLAEQFYSVTERTEWKLMATELQRDTQRTSLDSVGGYRSVISHLKGIIEQTLRPGPETDLTGGKQLSAGILLHGCHGAGKTLIAEALASHFGCSVVRVQPSDIFSSRIASESQKKLNRVFAEACCQQPSILLIDNIDVLAPCTAEGEDKKTLAALASCFDEAKPCRVVVIATSVSPEAVHLSLRRPARLENEVEIGVPTEEERRDILQRLVGEDLRDAVGEGLREAVRGVASITHGYVGADLAAVVSRARSLAGPSLRLSPHHLSQAVQRITPSAMRQAQLQVNKVKWDDIGGQGDLKMKMKQAVEWPLLHPESFSRLGIAPPRGLLMFGPPGCSKTMIARAIATETNLNFFSVKGSDIFSKWVGESERAVRELFGRARRVAPSVVFLDEVDALCPARDATPQGGGSAVQHRVLSQLLTEMDGVQPLNNVIVIAATNRPDRIDKAFLRPGRLDRLIYVPLPEASTRLQILRVTTARTPLAPCVDLHVLTASTQGYSGAEVVAVCNEAAMRALEEDMASSCVRMEHFHQALKLVPPRTPPSLLKIYEDYVNKSSYK